MRNRILKYHLIFSLMLCAFSLSAQTFNKTYSFDGQLEIAIHCLETADGYLLTGHGTDENSGSPFHLSMELFRVDEIGNVLDSAYHQIDSLSTDMGNRGALIEVESQSYKYIQCSSSIHNTSNVISGVITTFDDNLDIVWQKSYGSDSSDFLSSVLPLGAKSGNFLITGQTNNFQDDRSQLHAFAIDSNGVVLWDAFFGGMFAEQTSNAVKLSDNKYLLSGRTYSLANPHPYSTINAANLYLVCIDSLGNLLWENAIYGDGFDLYPLISETGIYTQPIESPVEILPPWSTEFVVGKFDLNNGSSIWVDTIQDSNILMVDRAKELANGDILLMYRIDSEMASSGLTKIVRMNSERQVKWERIYATGNVDLAWLLDFFEDSDGNLLLWGSVFYESVNSTDMWLLKLNENGCLNDTSCGVTTGIIDLTPPGTFFNLNLFPNPSHDFVHLSIENTSGYANEVLAIHVYNVIGEVVFQKDLTVNGMLPIVKIDLADWQSGNYVIAVSINGVLKRSGQLIKI